MGQGLSTRFGKTVGDKLPHLPNVGTATFKMEKLLNYALDPNSERGGHKAKVFKSALGFDKSNAFLLRDQVLAKLPTAEAIVKLNDSIGRRYQVDMEIRGVNDKIVNVRTGWIIRTGTTFPDLTSIYVKEIKDDKI